MAHNGENRWTLRTEDDVRFFVDCMSSSEDKEHLFSLVYLHIAVGTISHEAAWELWYLLSSNAEFIPLNYLRLDDAEAFFESKAGLAEAFTGFTAIKTLVIDGVGKHAALMLMTMESQLDSADLSLDGTKYLLHHELYLSDPIALLVRSKATLQRLKVSGAATGTGDVLYPEMRELTLELVENLFTYDYIRAFPNLAKLTLSCRNLFFNLPAICLALYRTNQDNQLEYRAWQALQHVSGSVIGVYLLGLKCRVRHLELTVTSEGDLDILCTVLNDTRPNALRLKTTCDRILHHHSPLVTICESRDEVHGSFKLIIAVEILPSDTIEAVRRSLQQTKHDLEGGPVTSLAFHIDCAALRTRRRSQSATALPNRKALAAVSYLRTLDVRKLVAEFLVAMRSLTYVEVILTGHPSRDDARAVVRYHGDRERSDTEDDVMDEDGLAHRETIAWGDEDDNNVDEQRDEDGSTSGEMNDGYQTEEEL